MIEAFPYTTEVDALERKDFLRFSGLFSQIVSGAVPTVEAIRFVENTTPFAAIFADADRIRAATAAFRAMKNGEGKAMLVADTLLFGFQLANGGFVTAIVTRVDPVFLGRVAEDWLLDVRESIEAEFLYIKTQFQDPETGLLNNVHLFSVLSGESEQQEMGTLLMEIAQPKRGMRDVFRTVQQVAMDLAIHVDERFLLHHLGQSVFALVVQDCSQVRLEKMAAALVQHLRREGYSRVQIGIARQIDHAAEPDDLLNRAWTALKTAARRGPFSFCDYRQLIDSANHPLAVGSLRVTRKLQRLAKKDSTFCLVKLSSTPSLEESPALLAIIADDGVYLIVDDDGAIFLYLSDYSANEGVAYATRLLAELRDVEGLEDTYCGVSVFPYVDFSRAETIYNVQKALLHAAFFGPGSVVLFEALSLNVSGDVYFSDGDLPRAVNEYRRGLDCDPRDINLLNSLGVAYALLNRSRQARLTFEEVLQQEPENYMALYNLGLDARQRGDAVSALSWFEKAGKCCDESDEGRAVKKDIGLQLGMLYCGVGRFDDALALLQAWRADMPAERQAVVFRYLGEAYLGIGDDGNAMKWLQRALQHNEFDAEAMGLLGSAVLRKKEGDEIALALCHKSVELAPDKPMLHFRLAEARLHNGQYREVLRSLNHCNTKSVDRGAVHLLKARTYAALDNVVQARRWSREVLQRYPSGNPYYEEAEKLYQTLS